MSAAVQGQDVRRGRAGSATRPPRPEQDLGGRALSYVRSSSATPIAAKPPGSHGYRLGCRPFDVMAVFDRIVGVACSFHQG